MKGADSYYILCPVKVSVYRGQIAGADWPTAKELKESLHVMNQFQTSADAIMTLRKMCDILATKAGQLLGGQ